MVTLNQREVTKNIFSQGRLYEPLVKLLLKIVRNTTSQPTNVDDSLFAFDILQGYNSEKLMLNQHIQE